MNMLVDLYALRRGCSSSLNLNKISIIVLWIDGDGTRFYALFWLEKNQKIWKNCSWLCSYIAEVTKVCIDCEAGLNLRTIVYYVGVSRFYFKYGFSKLFQQPK